MSRQEISDFERGRIIGMWEAGKSEREIAEKTAHPKTTVHDIIVKYRDLDQENHIQKIKKELVNVLQEEWSKIETEILENLVENIPRRVKAVIEAKGYPTKY